MKKIIFIFLITLNLLSNENRNNWNIDYKTDIGITTISFLIGILPSKLVTQAPSYMKEQKLDKNEINSFDSVSLKNYSPQSAKISDYLIIGMPLLSLGINGFNNSKSNFLNETVIFIETLAVSTALNTIVKFAVNRPRPYIYSNKASQEEKNKRDAYLSFYSGHSSFAFTTAVSFSSIMSHRYKKLWQKYIIWGTSLSLASTVAYLRVKAGKHFPSDVITGALIGSSIGWLIPHLHEKENISFGINKEGASVVYIRKF